MASAGLVGWMSVCVLVALLYALRRTHRAAALAAASIQSAFATGSASDDNSAADAVQEDAMLDLEELKTALKHDTAQRNLMSSALPDYPAVRRLVRDAFYLTLDVEETLCLQPGDLAALAEKLTAAIGKLEAARTALAQKGSEP